MFCNDVLTVKPSLLFPHPFSRYLPMERECIELNMWRVAEAAGAVPVAIELDYGTAHAAGITLNGIWRRGSE